ncbi:MAG: lipopolysaccharide biosynthesis protein [Pseudomonadota bacterium]
MSDQREQSRLNAASSWGRIRRNVGVLLSGRAIFALFNLAAAAIATRAAGLEVMGAVGLLLAYARLIGDVFKFNSWQAVLTYGAPMKAAGDRRGLRRLLGLTLFLDCAALTVSLVVAALGAIFAGGLMGWSEEMIAVAPWFCVIIVFITHMTPIGVLRLYDKIVPIASQHAVTAIVRLIGAILLWAFGGGFLELAAIWTVSAVIAGLLLWRSAWSEVREHIGSPLVGEGLRERRSSFPGFWRFAGATNVISTLNNVLLPVATLIVGAALGPTAAGIFHLVRQITDAMVRPGEILAQVVYPEFSSLAAEKDKGAMRRILKPALLYTALVQGAAVLILVLLGDLLLGALFGEEAAAGHGLLILSAIASSIMVCGFALEPALMSLGRADQAVWTTTGAWAAFALLTASLIPVYGLLGIGFALIGHRLLQFALSLGLVLRHLK